MKSRKKSCFLLSKDWSRYI